jgi:hypothetical protein
METTLFCAVATEANATATPKTIKTMNSFFMNPTSDF